MERLEFVPVGRDTLIELRSAWPHPSFIGRFLPESRSVNDAGFTARWRTSYFSTNVEQLLNQCGGRECAALSENALGVAFIQPVDIYLKAERAVKYGVLFVGLTFAVFFLFELFKRLAIHPIQYGLVGIALAIFYLLLLSLSEHLGFGLSYFIAATRLRRSARLLHGLRAEEHCAARRALPHCWPGSTARSTCCCSWRTSPC